MGSVIAFMIGLVFGSIFGLVACVLIVDEHTAPAEDQKKEGRH